MPAKDDKKNKKEEEKPAMADGSTQSTEDERPKMVTSGTQSSAKGTRGGEEKEKEPEPEPAPKKAEKKKKKEKPIPERKERVKEYFKTELDKLKDSLQKEADKIEKPPQKEFTPYTFTDLAPYLDVYSIEFLLNYPDEPDLSHTSRETAIGMSNPWDDYKMDTARSDASTKDGDKKKKKEKKEEKKEGKKEERPPKEGSTHLPKFPVVALETSEFAGKKVSYADVPKMREEIRSKYSRTGSETKILEEYERTKQDFYRMDLDRMTDIHPVNRPHMRAAYFAYLQNNPGSRKAVYDCLKTIEEKENKEKENGETDREDGNTTSRSQKSVKSRSSEKEKEKEKA